MKGIRLFQTLLALTKIFGFPIQPRKTTCYLVTTQNGCSCEVGEIPPYASSGADLGGAGGGRRPPSGIRPPADPKGPPFDTFSEIHFLPTNPKIFLKAPLAPIYTNFEGERAPKKRYFFVKIFQKVPKNGFF